MVNTGNITAGSDSKKSLKSLFWLNLIQVLLFFATQGQTQNNPCHFISVMHDLSSKGR